MAGRPPDLPPAVLAALDAMDPDQLQGPLPTVVDLGASSAAPFAPAEAQASLERSSSAQAMPPELRSLLAQLAGTPEAQLLLDLLEQADGAAADVDTVTAAAMTFRYAWLLQRVADGLTLTQAGYLPPAVVTETMDALWPADRWIGNRNREDLTVPVRRLRSSAQRLGLVRVHKGRLLVTKAGAAVKDDPDRLWRHVAERASARGRSPFAPTATALMLAAVAAGKVADAQLARIVGAAGWSGRGGAVSTWAVRSGADDLCEVLEVTDALSERDEPTAGGRALARVALQAWGS